MSTPDWHVLYEKALAYTPFLERHASPQQRQRWDASRERLALSSPQADLLASFTRVMPTLVLNAAWCGDCIQQCPTFDLFAAHSQAIQPRYLDRDEEPALRDALTINGGHRVPVVIFLSEDFFEVARYGERPLSTYRRLAAAQLGAACPTGLVPPDSETLQAQVGDWLDQFERAQLILRLSPRLRTRHGD